MSRSGRTPAPPALSCDCTSVAEGADSWARTWSRISADTFRAVRTESVHVNVILSICRPRVRRNSDPLAQSIDLETYMRFMLIHYIDDAVLNAEEAEDPAETREREAWDKE